MMMQPPLNSGRNPRWFGFVYAMIYAAGAVAVALTFTLAGLLVTVLWLPILIVIALGIAVFLAFNLRRNWEWLRNTFERQSEIVADSVSHVSTSPTLMAERHAERDGGGVFLTMAPGRLRDGRREPMILSLRSDRGVVLGSGSRGGKGRSIIAPTLARWPGSVVAFDPAGELTTITADHREVTLGQRVHVLDPFGMTGRQSAAWNPFDEITDDDPFLMDKVRLIAESLVESTGSETYWTDAARGLLIGVCLHVLSGAAPEARNLHTVRQLITDESPDAVWHAMQQNPAFGGLVRQYGNENTSREPKEINNVLQTLRVATDWLDSPAMQAALSHSSFNLIDLKRERMTLYLVLPPGRGASFSKWLRLLFNMAFDAMQDTSVAKPSDDVLFMLDEFPLLGRMERIERASGEAAKFGVKLFIVVQHIAQLKRDYKEMWETFIANSFLLIVFSNNDLETQQYISARLGKGWFTKTSRTAGGGPQGSGSTTYSEELQDVARPEEVGRQASRESGDAYFFVAGQKPWRLPRTNYDEWPFFAPAGLLTACKAARSGNTLDCPAVARMWSENSNDR